MELGASYLTSMYFSLFICKKNYNIIVIMSKWDKLINEIRKYGVGGFTHKIKGLLESNYCYEVKDIYDIWLSYILKNKNF